MRPVSIAFSTLLCLSLAGCSGSAPNTSESDHLSPRPSSSATANQSSPAVASDAPSNSNQNTVLEGLPESGITADGQYKGPQGFAFFDDPEQVFPAEIKHIYGTTTIPKQPKTIVTLGDGATDAVLMLARVPNAMPTVTGGEHNGMLEDWASVIQGFGIEPGSPDMPVMLDTTHGVPVDEIKRIKPDVILALENGITKAEYEQLSAFAPVVAPLHEPGTTRWEDLVLVTGQALGQGIHAKELTRQINETTEYESQNLTGLAGKTIHVGILRLSPTPTLEVYTPDNPRLMFYASYGFKAAPLPSGLEAAGDDRLVSVPAEKVAELTSDVMVVFVDGNKSPDAILTDPLVQQVPAAKRGNLMVITNEKERLATEHLGLVWYTSAFDDHINHISTQLNAN
ncbi:ABC transporter substrate-binding protein [Stomatohabitans albus]|uniref:ABC transporter substrate-binding protein n=1 Tax=Stomatohabitans albus TaxID=3110766 RepID=UPI00300D0252